MLKVQPNPTFKWPVKFPSPEGEQTLSLIYKHMGRDAYTDFINASSVNLSEYRKAVEAHERAVELASQNGSELPAPPKPTRTDLDEVMDIVAGWDDVDTPFSREALEQVINNYFALTFDLIIRGWIEGLAQRKLGN